MRVILLIILCVSQAHATFINGMKAPDSLELKKAPESYHTLYTFWRDQYEQSRILLENAQLHKRSAIEIPLFYTFKGTERVYDPPEVKDPYLGIVMGSPKLNSSSLYWLGLLILFDAKYFSDTPPKNVIDSAKFLAIQANSKKESIDDFLVFKEGLSPEDLHYIRSNLKWNTYQATVDVQKLETEISSHNISLNTYKTSNMKLHYEWPYLGYDPTLARKIDYAERFINANTYYSYEALNSDLAILIELRRQRDTDYEYRSQESQRLVRQIVTLEHEIGKLESKLSTAKATLARAKDHEARSDVIIATHKATLVNLYYEWGHKGDPFNRTPEEQRLFSERLEIDELFSQSDNVASPLNYWKRRNEALGRLKKNVNDFEKICALMDKNSLVKCVDMPEYLIDHDDAFIAKTTKAHYKAVEKALEDLHWINYEAVHRLQAHFADPDAYLDRILNWK